MSDKENVEIAAPGLREVSDENGDADAAALFDSEAVADHEWIVATPLDHLEVDL